MTFNIWSVVKQDTANEVPGGDKRYYLAEHPYVRFTGKEYKDALNAVRVDKTLEFDSPEHHLAIYASLLQTFGVTADDPFENLMESL